LLVLRMPPLARYTSLATAILVSLWMWQRCKEDEACEVPAMQLIGVASIVDAGESIFSAVAEAAAFSLSAAAGAVDEAVKDKTGKTVDTSKVVDTSEVVGEMVERNEVIETSEVVGKLVETSHMGKVDGTDGISQVVKPPITSDMRSVPVPALEAADDERPFIPAAKFAGAKPNFVFKSGPEGKGYYNRDYEWV